MAVNVAINGFGRIGRLVLRAIFESGRRDIEVVGINDLGSVETNAHFLRFDCVHGRFPGEVKVDGDTIDVGLGPIKVTALRDPAELPHAGSVSRSRSNVPESSPEDEAAAHLKAGAKRVLVSAPPTSADLTVVYGSTTTSFCPSIASSRTPLARPIASRRLPMCLTIRSVSSMAS